VRSVLPAARTILLHLHTPRRGLLVLSRSIVAFLALCTLERNDIASHLPLRFRKRAFRPAPLSAYSMTSVTVPAPMVRPPSRIAKRKPFSIPTSLISSTTICTLSPGITISVPSGSVATPVTSVVRK